MSFLFKLKDGKKKINLLNLLFLFSIIILISLTSVFAFLYFYSWKSEDLNYAAIVDCGSSGSRVYLYYWKNDGDIKYLPHIKRMRDEDNLIITKKQVPGLSSFEDKPQDSSAYLEKLIQLTYQYIPKKKLSETPLHILATAGMRSLPKEKSDKILQNLNENLQKKVKYKIETIKIIDGETEGFYMWMSLNNLLNKFKECQHPYNIIEMGGASLQIAYKVDSADKNFEFSYICQKTNVEHSHKIFSVTFLGLGVNSALAAYRNKIFTGELADSTGEPCIIKGCKFSEDASEGTGNEDKCFSRTQSVVDEILTGPQNDAVNKIIGHLRGFTDSNYKKFLALSSFKYAFLDFLLYDGPLKQDFYWNLAKEFCEKSCSIHQEYLDKHFYNNKEQKHLNSQCFRVALMRYIVQKFIPFNEDYPVRFMDSVKGDAIEWTLGAILYLRTRTNP